MSNMKKSRKIYRIGALLVVVCLISTVMLSGTFAKYVSEYSGQDTALVAKWDLTMKGGQSGEEGDFSISPGDTAELDLFTHAYNTNIVSGEGYEKIIAPGVQGSFVLDMTNNSDVAAAITFDLTEPEGNALVPMEYSIDKNFGDTEADIVVGAEELETKLNGLNITLNETSDNKDHTVYWRWAFDGTVATAGATDVSDTLLGTTSAENSRTEYKLEIKITATQVAPDITTPVEP